jgi:putative tryptophan/tyrosine transport system substrate-binding protein
MRRRSFFAVLIGSAVPWTDSALAQPSGKAPRRVGILNPETASFAPVPTFVEELRSLLRSREAPEIILDIRSAEGRYESVPHLASELVRAGAELIYTVGPDATMAAFAATKTIPIVAIDLESDPIAIGFVETLGRPGRNVTGMFLDLPEISGKWIELLGEITPSLSRVAVLGNPKINGPQFTATEAAARAAQIVVRRLEVQDSDGFASVFETAAKEGVGGVIVLPSPLVLHHGSKIADLAGRNRLPTVFLFAQAAEAGGLLAYGPSVVDMSKRAATLAAKILNGAPVASLPIERPTTFVLAINLKTAKALGLTIPPTLLARADEVIE